MISLLLFRWGNSGLQAQRAVVTCPKTALFMGPHGPILEPLGSICIVGVWLQARTPTRTPTLLCLALEVHAVWGYGEHPLQNSQDRPRKSRQGKSSLRSGTPENKTKTEREKTRHFPSFLPLHGDHFDEPHIGRALTVCPAQF